MSSLTDGEPWHGFHAGLVTVRPRQTRSGGAGPEQPNPGAYTYLSYLIGGMLVYGLIGWLVGRWTGLPVLFPVGMLVGLALAVALIIFRVTRS